MKRKNQILIKRIFQYLLNFLRPFVKNHIYIIRSGPARGLKRKGGLGFIPFMKDEEEIFLSQIDLRNKIVYDIGANIGIMTILFAKKVGPDGFVYAFEPNPDSIPLIYEILKVNNFSNVAVHQIAVGDKVEKGSLIVHKGQIGTGSLNSNIVNKFLKLGKNKTYEIEVFPLDFYIDQNKLALPDFIKIDTEGYELQCLVGMKNILEKEHPTLFIEMHAISDAHAEINSKNVIEFLDRYKYRVYNIRSKSFISKATYHLAKSGHLYCS